MSARTQLQSKPVADLRAIAEGLGLEHKGMQKAKLIDLLLEQGDAVVEAEEPIVAEVISKNDDSDLPSVVNSGDSQVKAGESREGILDILPEGYGFLRCSGYKPGDNDVFVPAGCELLIDTGQHVIAGETAIAQFARRPSAERS